MKNIFITILTLTAFQTVYSQEILTLEKAIQLTLEKNYDIKISQNTEGIAKNNSSVLNSGFLPSLSTGASGNYSITDTKVKLNNGLDAEVTDVNRVSYNANVRLDYVLFSGLGRINNLKKFKEQHKLSELQTEFVIENTLYNVARQYYIISQQYENINNIIESIKISSDRLLKTQYDFEYGQNTSLDILNAEVDLNNDSINLMNSLVKLENDKKTLNQLMGVAIDFDFITEAKVSFDSSLNIENLINDSKENNKTLNQSEKNILLNQFDIKIAKSNWLPQVNINGSYAFNNTNSDANSGFNSPLATNYNNSIGPSAQISLTWNLFDGGRTITNIQNSKINLENQKTSLEAQKQIVERDIRMSWANYKNAIDIINIQKKNLETNKTNFNRTVEKYKVGQVNSIYYRQAQLNLLNAENQLNIAKFNAKITELNLLRLSGTLIQ